MARHSFEPGDLVMCVQPAAIAQGDADDQPDPEYLVPALLEAARQPHVLAALGCMYDGTGAHSLVMLLEVAVVCCQQWHWFELQHLFGSHLQEVGSYNPSSVTYLVQDDM